MTDRYVVIGNPVAHSQSPFIHSAFAVQTAQDMSYGRLLCAPDGFESALRAFASGAGQFGSDDERDAVSSALVMWRARAEIARLRPATDPVTRIEGDIWEPATASPPATR